MSVANLSSHEWALCFLCIFCETCVEHVVGGALYVFAYKVVYCCLCLFWHCIMLEHHCQHGCFLLLVLVNDDNRLAVVGHSLGNHRFRVFGHFYSSEEFLYLSFHVVDVNIAYYNDALVVWSVPCLVVVAQELRLEIVYHAHQSYWHAESVFAIGVNFRQVALQQTLNGGVAHAPLLVNHTSFFVYLVLVEQQAVSPVAENYQASVHCSRSLCRHIVDVIHCLVDAGVGIKVCAEFHAYRLAVANYAVAWEMFCAVEAHVFEEVSQSALFLFLLDRSHPLRDIEVGSVLRPVVVADVIGNAIV